MDLLRMLVHLLLVRPLLHLVFGLNIVGRENLKGLDRFVMVANYNSHLDVLLLYAAVPLALVARTHPVAARDYFAERRILYRCLCLIMRPVWIDRGHQNLRATKEIDRRLENGASLLFFPEGTRGRPGEVQPFLDGIGLIARRHSDVPIVPVLLEGSDRAFPKGASVPIPVWTHVTISPPLEIQGGTRAIATRLHEHVAAVAEQAAFYRHRCAPARVAPLNVAIIGVDGSGKSTLARRLASHEMGNTCLLSDRLELFADGSPRAAQPLLMEEIRGWVHQRAKQAGNLSSYKLPKLADLLLRDRLLDQIERWYQPDRIFTDGAPLLNIIAWGSLYHEAAFKTEICARALMILTGQDRPLRRDPILKQFPELAALRNLRLNRLHLPDAVIFLDTPVPAAMERIVARGESVQAHECEEKLTRLRSAYQLVCEAVTGIRPVCQMDGTLGIDEVEARAKSFIDGIVPHEQN